MVEATLFEALARGDSKAVLALLASQPSLVCARDPQGVSALMHTLYLKNAELTELLLERREVFGEELDVFEAAALGRCERLRELLEEDAGLATRIAGDGFGAIHLAAFFGEQDAAKLLLEAGASPTEPADNPMEVRPLHSAVAAGSLPVVEILLAHDVDVNSRQAGGFTPLMGAAAGGHREIVLLLIERGAERELESDGGRRALELALERGHENLVDLLR